VRKYQETLHYLNYSFILLFLLLISKHYCSSLYTTSINRKLNVNFKPKPCIYFVFNKLISLKIYFSKFHCYTLIWTINSAIKLSLPPQNFVIFLIHCRKIKSDFKCYIFSQIPWKISNVSQFATQLDTWSTCSAKVLPQTRGLYMGGGGNSIPF